VRAVDPTLPMYDVLRIDRAIRLQFAEELLVTRLAVVFSTLALIVGAVGLYGVLVRGLSERRRELGIRTALGASPASVASLIAREAALMLAVGAAMGIGASLWLARFLDGHLFGVSRLDTAAFGAALGGVTIVMAAATAPVGRRAARTDPSALLRESGVRPRSDPDGPSAAADAPAAAQPRGAANRRERIGSRERVVASLLH